MSKVEKGDLFLYGDNVAVYIVVGKKTQYTFDFVCLQKIWGRGIAKDLQIEIESILEKDSEIWTKIA